MNVFDGLSAICFDATTALMGYDAAWTPKAGGPEQTARVHYSDATASGKIGDIDYKPETPVMEYKKGDMPGLKESIDDSELETVSITINGTVKEFFTNSVKTTVDGGTIIVELQVKES
jgi:hypothetical protein